ncbi:DUF3397 domain-containing protein [Salimicrobium sp. PL1-032A]|uniref:DUF3397 domain-containing protein n=1 Tax=Salimicrobium sp. PL1-032A TaxID=3095364 RepID=UPI0032606231
MTFTFLLIAALPFLFFVFTYMLFQKWTTTKKRAWRGAIHLSALIFVLAVHLLLKALFGNGYIGWSIVMLLSLMALSCIIQYKTREELESGKIFKGFLRLSFLTFAFTHALLVVYGLMNYVFFSA